MRVGYGCCSITQDPPHRDGMIWPFNLLFRKSPKPDLVPAGDRAPIRISQTADYLGKGVALGKRATEAIRRRDLELAWRLLHEQKEQYSRHAIRYGMTARQAMALDASVHEQLANIRRIEANHHDALIHLLHAVLSSPRPTKAQAKSLSCYFERCRFENISDSDFRLACDRLRADPSLAKIRNVVLAWA